MDPPPAAKGNSKGPAIADVGKRPTRIKCLATSSEHTSALHAQGAQAAAAAAVHQVSFHSSSSITSVADVGHPEDGDGAQTNIDPPPAAKGNSKGPAIADVGKRPTRIKKVRPEISQISLENEQLIAKAGLDFRLANAREMLADIEENQRKGNFLGLF
jgi:hypothetical protein